MTLYSTSWSVSVIHLFVIILNLGSGRRIQRVLSSLLFIYPWFSLSGYAQSRKTVLIIQTRGAVSGYANPRNKSSVCSPWGAGVSFLKIWSCTLWIKCCTLAGKVWFYYLHFNIIHKQYSSVRGNKINTFWTCYDKWKIFVIFVPVKF